ncbi:MAG: chromosome segregation protein SMC [Clostridia bacterium]|jgi:chromosome segregation protein SMC
MYLKRLELQGFKSFADKTILEFMPGITTVIGPNGSGKSNISDAIRWVLGEQSIKSLRGAKSEDIIFAGTQNRKSLGFAEASLVFDNNDGKLPIEYAEVTVTRRIYRTGETGYFINKTPCRLKDILELFMDTGIGKDGYSIIGQGKIDEILSNKSEDRRHIFEEAAGIVKYRSRKEDSEKKLERAKLNLLRINDILAEIENNIEPLKIQSEKAKKFLSLREELKGIEVGLFLYNIDLYKERLEKITADEEIMNATYESEENSQKLKNEEKNNLKLEINNLIEEIEKMQNIGFESTNQIEKINSNINVSEERINNIKENNIRYETEINELNEKINELKEEEKQKIAKKENLYNNKEKFEKELKEKEEELSKLTTKLSSKQLEIENKKRIIEENTDNKYEMQNEINTQDVKVDSIIKNVKSKTEELDLTISELDQSRLKKSEIEQNFLDIENKRNKIKNDLSEIENKKIEADNKIKTYELQINQLGQEIRIKESRLKFLEETEKEKEGYTKSVKSLLKSAEVNEELKKGLHDVVANLINVKKEYEIAIEMALGASLQNVVTETEQDAKRLIEYLRNNNLGRVTFLPISAVNGKKLEKAHLNIKGVIGIASDLVEYNNKYDGIFKNLLGRTVIVEDMEAGVAVAKKNSYSFRIVTLKGDIINSSGAMTGGSVQAKTVNILGRSREIEALKEELKSLDIKIKNKEEEKEKYIESIEDLLETIESLETNLQEIDIEYATQKQKVELIVENVDKLVSRMDKTKQEIENLNKQKTEIIEHKKQLIENLENLEEEIQKLNLEVEEFVRVNKDDQTYIDNLNMDITNLKISVSSFEESEMSIDEITERIKIDIKNNTLSLESKKDQIEKNKQEEVSLKAKIDELQNDIVKIKENVKNSGSKIEELKNNKNEKNTYLEKIEKEIEEQFTRLQDIKEQLVKIDIKKNKTSQDLEDVVNKLWEEYELTPNNADGFTKTTDQAKTQKEVNYLRTQIRDLGSINIDSIKEYQTLKERYDFMCEQRLDLENSMSKLKNVISEMINIMKTQFKDKFKLINKNFNEVFTELFGGGKAELILENEEDVLNCGIDIRVQPPGKKLQNMTLLSGGEKAFTAIAILFAILKINPAPFCVLDEIEAALDDVNVNRYAEYLKKFSQYTQFLVITHRKGTMEAADTVYGITMEENGISKLLSMKLK